jgi:hypothetical protein
MIGLLRVAQTLGHAHQFFCQPQWAGDGGEHKWDTPGLIDVLDLRFELPIGELLA